MYYISGDLGNTLLLHCSYYFPTSLYLIHGRWKEMCNVFMIETQPVFANFV